MNITASLTNSFHGLIHSKKLFKNFELKAFDIFITLWVITNYSYFSLLSSKIFIFHEVNSGLTLWGTQSENSTNLNIQLLLIVKCWEFFFNWLTYKNWSCTTKFTDSINWVLILCPVCHLNWNKLGSYFVPNLKFCFFFLIAKNSTCWYPVRNKYFKRQRKLAGRLNIIYAVTVFKTNITNISQCCLSLANTILGKVCK